MNRQDSQLLAGDLGATKTTLALYRVADWPGPPLRQQTFRNAEFIDFDSLLNDFLVAGQPVPATVCLGVAGPILNGAVRMTNLDWLIDPALLQARFGFSQIVLINDLVATAAGIPLLTPQDLHPLNPEARPDSAAPLAVLAPGSGLGEAFLIPYHGALLPCPSEGGHASFAPRTEEQLELLAFLRQRHPHVSVEQVCSGMALPALFAFLATRMPIPSGLQAELVQAADQTPVIVRAALDAVEGGKPCAIAIHTLELFFDILADEAANLALKTMALGGVFIGGGLMARLRPLIDPQRFMTIFCRGTYREMLARIPVQIIVNPQTALLGAAARGIEALRQAGTASSGGP
jgi:glucokinase